MRRGFVLARLWPFLLGGAIGVPAGIALLGSLDAHLFRIVIGSFLMIYGATMLMLRSLPKVHAGGRLADAACGFTGGVMGGFAGLPGPPPTIWTAPRGLSPDRQRRLFQLCNAA